MKLNMNKFSIFGCVLFLTACTQPYDRTDYVDPQKLSEDFFGEYGYEYKNNLKKEKSETNIIYVEKNKMTKMDFIDSVEPKVKEKGWVLIKPLFEDQYSYCFGKKNRMNVTYPTKEYYENISGNVMNIKKENMSKWVISLSYDAGGDKRCKDVEK
ncbi:hypothetical protein [Acinetobacter haemolyticus]|uniref:Lipoprotein n=1 Tax=Acinetobacter haemolyticus TaxID=29430 RepID=A0A4P7B3T8_ACIHA|nr:hypothetical protein [Acinetobacter haemolyticus]QBQ15871.1 hypothetical protein AHTJR_06160 [Acinetobacter haemolyticus]